MALADQMAAYLQGSSLSLVPYRPGIWARTQGGLRRLGEKVGRKRHRIVIMVLLALDGLIALLVGALLVWAWFAIALAALFTNLAVLFVLFTYRSWYLTPPAPRHTSWRWGYFQEVGVPPGGVAAGDTRQRRLANVAGNGGSDFGHTFIG